MPDRVFLSSPHLGTDELSLIQEAFESNWVAPLGPHIDAFERELADYVGVAHACALSSGTAAVHLALRILGVGPGDDVLCSTFTFCASANPIVYLGARPVFVDAEPATWCLDVDLVASAIEDRSRSGHPFKAIVAVDLYGQCPDYSRLEALCDQHGIALVEDAAEALGARYLDRAAGSFGRCGVFSFNGNKIITTSGGGMLVSDDASMIEEARFLATQARAPAPHYEHETIGYNYRLSNVLAAIGRGQLRVLDAHVEARRDHYRAYTRYLGGLPGIGFCPAPEGQRPTHWLTCITVDATAFGASRDDIRDALEAANIEARPVWKPMHLQPVFADCEAIGGDVSAALFETGLCLPSGSNLSAVDRDRIIEIVRDQCRGE